MLQLCIKENKVKTFTGLAAVPSIMEQHNGNTE